MRDPKTYVFEVTATRAPADRPEDDEVLLAGAGAVGLAARTGRVEVDLSGR